MGWRIALFALLVSHNSLISLFVAVASFSNTHPQTWVFTPLENWRILGGKCLYDYLTTNAASLVIKDSWLISQTNCYFCLPRKIMFLYTLISHGKFGALVLGKPSAAGLRYPSKWIYNVQIFRGLDGRFKRVWLCTSTQGNDRSCFVHAPFHTNTMWTKLMSLSTRRLGIARPYI